MNKILMKGNEACAEASIRAGLKCYFGYPITPQSEITEYMAKELPKRGGVFLQSESEIAAINMVFGASAAGVRAMTSSSGPGISLKQEGISYIACAKLPAVIVNVSRGGPGLGNIAPSQGDYFQATKGGGHGDYHLIVLAPSTVQEFADLTTLAFDLADTYRNPVMLLVDGLIGQMMEPVEFKNTRYKIQDTRYKKDWALTGAKGRRPNRIVPFAILAQDLEKIVLRLEKKYQLIRDREQRLEFYNPTKMKVSFDVILVGYGTVGRILKTVAKKAQMDGLNIAVIRPITLWPFPYKEMREKTKWAREILVVEMNNGQMVEDVKGAIGEPIDESKRIHSYCRMGGVVPTVEEILEEIERITGSKK